MLSAVIPVLNEVDSLATLHREIREVAAAEKLDVEIIFVDDGSSDGSWEVISRLAGEDPRRAWHSVPPELRQGGRPHAGFHAARGERIVTMDADLQDDPHEIPRFLNHMDVGFDVVSGWKLVRHDPWHKVLPSPRFNWHGRRLTGVHLHDHNCGMKSYRREIFDEVRLYGELHRFVPVLAHARGFKVSEIWSSTIGPRRYGKSKYGVPPILEGVSRSAHRQVPDRLSVSGRNICWERWGWLPSYWAG